MNTKNKKNKNIVCVFPDTMPQERILFPLLQFFDQVVYLRPVEDDTPDQENVPPFFRQALADKAITFDCPAPLGDDKERFLHLVRDLRSRPDDYAGQLANLSLAGLGRHSESESKTTIISTLFQQKALADRQDEQRIMVLWQARLVLALGETFDNEQNALQKNLARISSREQGLLDELRKEEEQPFSLTRKLSSHGEKTDRQLKLRLKAWSRLFGLGDKQHSFSLFLTTNHNAFHLLLEHNEAKQQKQPEKMIDLLLPADAEYTPEKLDSTFREKTKHLLTAILNTESCDTANEKKTLKELSDNWTDMMNRHYPQENHLRLVLSLYKFPGTTAQKLFLETFGQDQDEVQLSPKAAMSPTAAPIIGLIQAAEKAV